MPIKHFFAGVPVTDLGQALAWYERLLGRTADASQNTNEAVWHVTDSASIYVVADAKRAGVPGLYEKVVISDPDGNMIQMGQTLSALG